MSSGSTTSSATRARPFSVPAERRQAFVHDDDDTIAGIPAPRELQDERVVTAVPRLPRLRDEDNDGEWACFGHADVLLHDPRSLPQAGRPSCRGLLALLCFGDDRERT